MTDAATQYARKFQSDLDRWEKEYDSLVSDLRWYLKNRHKGSYRSEISELIAELRQFS